MEWMPQMFLCVKTHRFKLSRREHDQKRLMHIDATFCVSNKVLLGLQWVKLQCNMCVCFVNPKLMLPMLLRFFVLDKICFSSH